MVTVDRVKKQIKLFNDKMAIIFTHTHTRALRFLLQNLKLAAKIPCGAGGSVVNVPENMRCKNVMEVRKQPKTDET